MKKLLVGLLALGSVSSFAMTEFEINLSESFNTLSGSKNYEAKYINDDGSISIIKPRFSNPEGNGNLYISQFSDLNGLCKLYGLGDYVSNSRRKFNQRTFGLVVRINSNARFSQFDPSLTSNAIESFSCTPVEGMPSPTLISDNHTGVFQNDDGSTTIVKPKFKINGKNSYISELSDLNGLCKLYGLGDYVSNSRKNFNQGRFGLVVRINSNARFSQFDASNSKDAIESLMCY
jgi:hypothetical protein